MNTYKITFHNSDTGNQDYEHFTAANEKDAKRELKKSYLNDNALAIDEVELIRENVPATKQQERETLNNIALMVQALGAESYVAAAFKGCFEIAESNIENDFGENFPDRLVLSEERTEQAVANFMDEERRYEEILCQNRSLENENEILKLNALELNQKLYEAHAKTQDAENRAAAAEATIQELKAKLYDYITAVA